MTGGMTFDNDSILAWVRNTDFAKIGFKNESDSDADSYMWFETGDNGDEYFKWRTVAGNTTKDLMTLKFGLLNVLVGAVINGSLGIGTTNALGGNSIALGDNVTGFKQNGDGVLDVYSNKRDRRMAEATARIDWLDAAQKDGDITGEEEAELAALRAYRTALRRLDLTTAPDVKWPEYSVA